MNASLSPSYPASHAAPCSYIAQAEDGQVLRPLMPIRETQVESLAQCSPTLAWPL